MHVCVFVYVCVSLCAHMCVHVVRLRIPVNLIRCITTECQCSANCTILWGQNKVYKFCMAASPCSCAPLPLAKPGPLLPAGGQGLGGKVQAEWGGASSLLVTLNNRYFLLPLPKKTELLPLEKSIYFTTVSRVIRHRPLQKTIVRGGDILYVLYSRFTSAIRLQDQTLKATH